MSIYYLSHVLQNLVYVKFILTRPLVLSGFISAVLASVAWIGAISKFELSYAYPFMSLSFVLVVVLSLFFFGENINWFKIVGLVFFLFTGCVRIPAKIF